MFKEYIQAGHQNQPVETRSTVAVDLMAVTSYWRVPQNSYTYLYTGNINNQVHMTAAEFEEFKVNLKTANRLKRGYE
jgi:hypothetical protein